MSEDFKTIVAILINWGVIFKIVESPTGGYFVYNGTILNRTWEINDNIEDNIIDFQYNGIYLDEDDWHINLNYIKPYFTY